MRSLRTQLFLAILGAVLVAVGASLALGVVLTKNAVRDTIQGDVEAQAEGFASQFNNLTQPPAGRPPGGPAGGAGGPEQPVSILTFREATSELPGSDAVKLVRDGSVAGSAHFGGSNQIYAAVRVGRSVVLVTRPDVVSGDDFSRYLSALLIASGVAALLAAAIAALLARRLTEPLRRLGTAAGELAAGRRPEPVPRERTEELDDLAVAFNGMSEQLLLARDAERGVLLSVSHDLRTPLTSVRGYAEGIEDGTL